MRLVRRRGYSLVEALVAVVLLGVGVAAAISCLLSASRLSLTTQEYTAAYVLANERLSVLESSRLQTGSSDGTVGEAYPGYRWSQSVEPADVEGLYRVRLVISWGEDRPRSESFVTLIRDPEAQSEAPPLAPPAAAPPATPRGGGGGP